MGNSFCNVFRLSASTSAETNRKDGEELPLAKQGISELPQKSDVATRPDPADFMLMSRKNETIVREPGQINGEQFLIDGCENCDIYLFDNSAQVMVDYAKGCRIFIGPCESSVFLRNCEDCKTVIACQQLRTRDCKNIDLMLFSTTQPSIETSIGLKFACFDYSYFSLREQFVGAGLCIWNNEWSRVHDFNAEDGKVHYIFLPEGTKAEDLLIKNASEVSSTIERAETEMTSVVPAASSASNIDGVEGADQHCVVLVFGGSEETALELVSAAHDSRRDSIWLLRTRLNVLNKEQIETLFADVDGVDRSSKSAAVGDVIGLEFVGADVRAKITEFIDANAKRNTSFVSRSETEAMHLGKAFFEQLKPSI